MRLNQHPAIRDGEIADASRRQHTSQLGKMRQLLRLFTDMFDHMVGKNDVKTVVREGQLRAVDQVKAIALRDPPTVQHVDRLNGAVHIGMRCAIMRNSTCYRTTLKHSDLHAPGTEVTTQLARHTL